MASLLETITIEFLVLSALNLRDLREKYYLANFLRNSAGNK